MAELEAALARHRDEAGQLTAAIRRLIAVMKQEDLLAEDITDEYRRLLCPAPTVSERSLRPLLKLPAVEQQGALQIMIHGHQRRSQVRGRAK